MSVTFNVYPLKSEIPTLLEVVDLTIKKLNKFLKSYEIDFEAYINLILVSYKDETEKWDEEVDLNSGAEWDNESEYILFKLCTFKRGINVHYWEIDEAEQSDYLEEVLDRVEYTKYFKDKSVERKELVKNCFKNKRVWHVKQWANQAWMTSVAFGFIASSFAELTDGIIFSTDGGWDHQIFPATAEEFDAVYFRPEKSISEDRRENLEGFVERIKFEIDNL